jgi:hypothetical protein
MSASTGCGHAVAFHIRRGTPKLVVQIKTIGQQASVCVSKTSSVLIAEQNHITSARMVALISFLLNVVASLFKSKSRLEAEKAALRHELIVLQGKVRARP